MSDKSDMPVSGKKGFTNPLKSPGRLRIGQKCLDLRWILKMLEGNGVVFKRNRLFLRILGTFSLKNGIFDRFFAA